MTKTASSAQYLIVSESDGTPGPGLEAFDAIYQREFTYVWRTLGRLGMPAADLPDGVHDVFVVVYRRWAEVDPERPIRPWLFGIARRVAAASRRRRRDVLEPAPEPLPSDSNQIARRDLLWKLLAALDEDRREVVILHDLEGYTGADIARMLGIPLFTVHSRLRLARAELAEAVGRARGER